jgi:hypothetical protein
MLRNSPLTAAFALSALAVSALAVSALAFSPRPPPRRKPS